MDDDLKFFNSSLDKFDERIKSLKSDTKKIERELDDAFRKEILDEVNSCCDFIKDVVSTSAMFFGICFILQMIMIILHL